MRPPPRGKKERPQVFFAVSPRYAGSNATILPANVAIGSGPGVSVRRRGPRGSR